jgi:beta-barrel assembly-enhancing protease
LVWLFQEFQNSDPKQVPQLLSDHPANGTRVETLKQHFRENPSIFCKFDSRPETATPFVIPKDAPERFLGP